MIRLSVVHRELAVAARRPGTHWLRFFLALAAAGTWLTVMLLGQDTNPGAGAGPAWFGWMGSLAFAFCLLAGVFLTADCLSEEKREGTLGLLFLSGLRSYDVVGGKLLATSLQACYGLVAVLPLLGLPLLTGGVTAGEFWRLALALLATLLLSLSIGAAVSAVSFEAREGVVRTLAIVVGLAGAPPVFGWLQSSWLGGRAWDPLLAPSPAWLCWSALDAYFTRPAFLGALGASLALSSTALVFACACAARTWRDKQGAMGPTGADMGRWRTPYASALAWQLRAGLRRENLFYWLASRDRKPERTVLRLVGAGFAVWLAFLVGVLSSQSMARDACFEVCLLLSYGLHQLLKFLFAWEASRRLSDDRRSGALELLLVTPLSPQWIVAGQKRALSRLFLWPRVWAILTNVGVFWAFIGLTSPGIDSDDLVLFGEFLVFGSAMLYLDCEALAWVGMWLALRSRRHSRAVFGSLAQVMLPPWVAAGVFFLLVTAGPGGGPSRGTGILLLTTWFGFGAVLDLILAGLAREKLATQFRSVAART